MRVDNIKTKKDKTSTEYSRVFLFVMPSKSNRPKRSTLIACGGHYFFRGDL